MPPESPPEPPRSAMPLVVLCVLAFGGAFGAGLYLVQVRQPAAIAPMAPAASGQAPATDREQREAAARRAALEQEALAAAKARQAEAAVMPAPDASETPLEATPEPGAATPMPDAAAAAPGELRAATDAATGGPPVEMAAASPVPSPDSPPLTDGDPVARAERLAYADAFGKALRRYQATRGDLQRLSNRLRKGIYVPADVVAEFRRIQAARRALRDEMAARTAPDVLAPTHAAFIGCADDSQQALDHAVAAIEADGAGDVATKDQHWQAYQEASSQLSQRFAEVDANFRVARATL